MNNAVESKKVGDLLREWRGRRRLSQLDLALETEISSKHLSFLETGRAQPSREMILRLASQLAIPLRARNVLLTAGGFAPVFSERPLNDSSLESARKIVELVLKGHEPNPSLALDRHWNLVAANKAVGFLLSEVDSSLLTPPVNVLRLSLHPKGLAPQIINYAEWREHLLERLRRQIEITADAGLLELFRELKSFPKPKNFKPQNRADRFSNSNIAVPIQLDTGRGELSFLSLTTVFGTPVDITLAELIIESFFPTDEFTAEVMNEIRG
ncbi:MAG: helix-turn-helix domain-containing protein [Acidobacteria bacterium]|nr:helix-turn-helix domain-containing protein [Acidobacteriota bacterium]MBA4186185.1 helix-turn-helix domain-containing protein [Acidobacteriota bacterium]